MLGLPDPGRAQGNIRLSSHQDATEQVVVRMADEDDRGHHGSMASSVPTVAINTRNRSRAGFAEIILSSCFVFQVKPKSFGVRVYRMATALCRVGIVSTIRYRNVGPV